MFSVKYFGFATFSNRREGDPENMDSQIGGDLGLPEIRGFPFTKPPFGGPGRVRSL